MRAGCERGLVFAEFLIAFPVIFLLFLGVLQLALLGAASLIVRHAAYRGARELALVADEDPAHVEGAARMALQVGGQARNGRHTEHGPRMQRVEDVVFSALRALAPSAKVATAWASGKVPPVAEGALDPSALRTLVGELYTPRATDLEVGTHPGAGLRVIVPGQPAKVKVVYRYVCAVPVVNAIICDSIVDVPGSDALQQALGFQLPRLVTLEARAEAVIHHAPYVYRSEHD